MQNTIRLLATRLLATRLLATVGLVGICFSGCTFHCSGGCSAGPCSIDCVFVDVKTVAFTQGLAEAACLGFRCADEDICGPGFENATVTDCNCTLSADSLAPALNFFGFDVQPNELTVPCCGK